MASDVGTGWAAGNQILLVWLQLPLNMVVSGELKKCVREMYHLVTAGNTEARQTRTRHRQRHSKRRVKRQV